MWSLPAVFSLQWGLHVPLPQQKPTSLQYAPPPGPAVSLRRRTAVGERHRNVHPVGRRLGTHRLERFSQNPERVAATWDAVSGLQGWTLVRSWRSCGEPAGQEATRSESQMLRRGTILRLCPLVSHHWHAQSRYAWIKYMAQGDFLFPFLGTVFDKTVCSRVKMVVFILVCALANQLLELAQQIFLKSNPPF